MAARKKTSSVSSEKKPAKRGLSWTDEESDCLISLWAEHNVESQMEDPKKNKGSIYQMLSDQMKDQSYKKSCVQCKIWMHTMKRLFWDCKENQKTSGKGRKLCKFYEKLNELLGQQPASSREHESKEKTTKH